MKQYGAGITICADSLHDRQMDSDPARDVQSLAIGILFRSAMDTLMADGGDLTRLVFSRKLIGATDDNAALVRFEYILEAESSTNEQP